MPSKGKGGGFKNDEILTGVLLADNFDNSFHPATITKPKCLMQLANEPLLHYSLHLLQQSGVEKIIIFCKDSNKEIIEYLEKSKKWANNYKHGKIVVLPPNPDVNNVGDMFRKLDTLNIITDDFIFVPFDVVSNANLSKALQEHKQRKSSHPVDKTAPLLTIVLTDNVSTKHELRQLEDDVVIAYGTKDFRLHHFGKTKSGGKQSVPMSVFKECNRLSVSYQVLDSGVWICSEKVIEVFSENFDYETQDIFVKRVIDSFEFLGKEIHVHLLQSDYCCRVTNLTRHCMVQCDIINRKICPLFPETFRRSMHEGQYNLAMKRDYLHSTCKPSSVLKGSTFMIGSHTEVGSSVTINESAVANNCSIGSYSVIEKSTLLNNVKVGGNSVITNSFICGEVEIGSNTKIDNCLICSGVKISDDIEVPKGSILVCYLDKGSNTPVETQTSFVGKDGKGKQYSLTSDIFYEDNSLSETTADLANKLWGLSINNADLESDDDVESVSSDEDMTFDSDDNDDSNMFQTVKPQPEKFKRDVDETIVRLAEEPTVEVKNLIQEINASRHAYNVPWDGVTKTVTTCIMEHFIKTYTAQSADKKKSYGEVFKDIVKLCKGLLDEYIVIKKGDANALQAITSYSIQNPVFLKGVPNVLNYMYMEDLLQAESIIEWYNKDPLGPVRSCYKGNVEKLKEYLEESSEEESGEDSDEDSE